MQNPRLDEAQAGIKISGRNINNLRYADDITLMAESKEELQFMGSHRVATTEETWQQQQQSTSREMLSWMKHKLESKLLGKISIISDMQITPP